MTKKETIYLISTTILSTVVIAATLGVKVLKPNETTVINVYDTYFVVAYQHLIFPIATLVFFSVYVVRVLRRSFKNSTANVIFMIANVLLMLLVVFFMSVASSYGAAGSIEYPPLSGGTVEIAGNFWDTLLYVLIGIEMLLLLLLTVAGIKTVRNYKCSK